MILLVQTRDKMRSQAIGIADGMRAHFNIRFTCFLNLTKLYKLGREKLSNFASFTMVDRLKLWA